MKYKEKPKMMVFRGLLQVIIAYIIYRYGDMYGYEIKRKLEEIHGKKLPHGLVYITLKRMVNSDILEIYEKDGKKYYKLSEGGKEFLDNHVKVLQKVRSIIDEIVNFMNSTH